MTPLGPRPIGGVDIYCDACGAQGHTQVTTDDNGVYDFGGGGIWLRGGSSSIDLLIFKDGYDVPGSSALNRWSRLPVTISNDTRFDFRMNRR